jgi:quercetin 2,3-dioxygenase
MRSIKKIHKAAFKPIDDLITYSPIPSKTLQHIDPFLFLNHHGPQVYAPKNNGLPFGPHPHRGMETVTIIVDGDISHRDSAGSESVIKTGGIQWMTAGSGLIHAETSSEEFKRNGGNLEILQLWVNLPASHKMTSPNYTGLNEDKIPLIKIEESGALIKLISGSYGGYRGAFDTISDVMISVIEIKPGNKLLLQAPALNNVFFYIIKGNLKIGGTSIEKLHLAEFNNDADGIEIESESESLILFGHAKPFNEPIAAYGPFVMNSEEEIEQAYKDYKAGKFGEWKF